MSRLAILPVRLVAIIGLYASFAASTPAEPNVAAAAPAAAAGESKAPHGYWSVGQPRWFVSSKSDLGLVYIKPYFSFGYGLPHWIWAGIDVNAILTTEFVQAYAGVRATTPLLDLAFGVRDTQSFGKPWLRPAASLTADDVVNGATPKARFWAWEAEFTGILPLPASALVADLILVRNLELPAGRYFYSESYRAVIAQPFFATLRLAAVLRLMKAEALKVGVLTEHVFETGRESPVFRVGPVAIVQLTDYLEAQAALTLPVKSPDKLGLALGSYGVLGLRYRWATGTDQPLAPWRGSLIL